MSGSSKVNKIYLDINTVWMEALSTLYTAYEVAIFPLTQTPTAHAYVLFQRIWIFRRNNHNCGMQSSLSVILITTLLLLVICVTHGCASFSYCGCLYLLEEKWDKNLTLSPLNDKVIYITQTREQYLLLTTAIFSLSPFRSALTNYIKLSSLNQYFTSSWSFVSSCTTSRAKEEIAP